MNPNNISVDVPVSLGDFLKRMPKYAYAQLLANYVNGTVQMTRKGTAKIPLELDIEQFGGPCGDIRDVISPTQNDLVPLILFVDMKAARENPPPETAAVSLADLRTWREEWLEANDPGDGTDVNTPFDAYLWRA